jgi:phage gp36-like protein
MSYASVNDMVIRFGEAKLLRLAMTPTGELDQAAITIALQDAGALIDGYLAGRYPLPLAHIPSALVPICADIARHRLYGEQAPEQIAKRNEAALGFLKGVGIRWGHPGEPEPGPTAVGWARLWPESGARQGGLSMSQPANPSGTELDYLQAGERLRELLTPLKPAGLKEVFVATDVAAIANLGQHSPAVHVVYQGERENEGTQSGRASSFDQLWLLVLVHRASPREVSAGVWLARILQAVSGRACGDSTFRRVTPPVKPSYSGGAAYLPLAFTTRVKFKGER